MSFMNKYGKNLKTVLFVASIVLFSLAALCLCSCALKAARPSGLDKVKVSLVENSGVIFEGGDCLEVTPGKSAEFTVIIRDGYIYQGNSAGAHYNPKTGKLTLSVVKYPTSIEFYLINTGNMMKLELEAANSSMVYHDGEDEWFDEGDTVTVTAKESSAYNFIGWSVGNYADKGGVIVSTDTVYTFSISEGIKLYANYKQADQYTIVYHPNGGVIKGGGETLTVSTKKGTQFTCRNTIHSNETFTREGYVAVGYSTEPVNFEDYATVNDIPGFSNMGGICVVPEETCLLDLYVVWAKATPTSEFRIEKNGSEWIVAKYTGKSSVVVIPESIGGQPITKIKANAFSGATLKNVVIPRGVTTIENSAFNGCTNLKQVVFFDGVTQVRNTSFVSCNKLSTIVLNAQMLPHYAGGGEGSFCIKYERVKTAPGKMLVVVSGSSTLNGMDSKQFQEAYPDYTIVNYGTNAGTPSYFYLKVIANYVGEGDIIIHAGEHGSTTMGSNQIQWKLFRGNEQSYDIFREVDMTQFTNFWDAFYEFQWFGEKDPNKQQNVTVRTKCAVKEYQTYCSSMNEYGDLITNRASNRGYGVSASYDFFNPSNYLNSANAVRLNEVARIIKNKGGQMLGSFATMDVRCVKNPTQAAYDHYTQYFRDALDYPVISNVATYTMHQDYFYDSQWHCTNVGADIRTKNLLADLKAYLDNPSNY